MKYREMMAKIEADKLARANAAPTDKPVTPQRVANTSPTFQLWRVTVPTVSGCEYAGSLKTPDGKVYSVEATIVEHAGGRHFEGQIYAVTASRMLHGAKVSGERRAIPNEVLDLVEQANSSPAAPRGTSEPFNDPLPEIP